MNPETGRDAIGRQLATENSEGTENVGQTPSVISGPSVAKSPAPAGPKAFSLAVLASWRFMVLPFQLCVLRGEFRFPARRGRNASHRHVDFDQAPWIVQGCFLAAECAEERREEVR